MDANLTIQVKSKAHHLGADLVGVANIERFEKAPIKLSPRWIFPEAKSVVVFAIHHPDACVELGGEPEPQIIGPYAVTDVISQKLIQVSFKMARFIENLGYRTVPLDVTDKGLYRPNRFPGYEELESPFRPDISHIYASVAAGLSGLGWTGLAITPEKGPRNRFISIITAAPLVPDPLQDGSKLCDRCGNCAAHCPTNALDIQDTKSIEIEGRTYIRADKNLWRCAWAEHFMLDLNLPIPEHIDEGVLLENVEKHGLRTNAFGNCLRFCLPPHLRMNNPVATRPHLRKRHHGSAEAPIHRSTIDMILEIARHNSINYVEIQRGSELRENGIDLTDQLPGASSVILLGLDFQGPVGAASEEMLTPDTNPWLQVAVKQNKYEQTGQLYLDFATLDIAREVEKLGYSTIVKTDLDNQKIAEIAGIKKGDQKESFFQLFDSVVMDAPFESLSYFISDETPLRPRESLTQKIKTACREAGADLIGISSVDRLDAAFTQLKAIKDGEELLEAEDHGLRFMPYEPVVRKTYRKLYRPKDYLNDVKSVIVVGLHFPGIVVERAADPGSDAVGPYVFTQHQTQLMLGQIGFTIVKRIQSLGYHAVYTFDSLNIGSKVATPAGLIYNATCNSIDAVAAGLGELAYNGTVMTEKYGANQRFLTIMTNVPLEADEVTATGRVGRYCKSCKKCLAVCPAGALREIGITEVQIDGVGIPYLPVNTKRCDWSSKYSLCAEDGMKYLGSQVDLIPPDNIDERALSEALKKSDPILKHRRYTVEQCIVACPLSNDPGGVDSL
jgi:epoxyqueuosine reductase QueG